MATEMVNPAEQSQIPIQDPTDWVRVCHVEDKSDFEWRPSDGSVHLCAVSTRDGVALPQTSLSLSDAPHRSSMVYEAETDRITRGSPMPPKVLCVIVVFLRQELHICRIPLHLDDRDEQTFENEIMQRILSYVRSQSPTDRRSYIRAGRVRLLALSDSCLTEKATSSVENGREWDRHVTKMIANYCSKDDDYETPTPFMLEVRMEFEWLVIDKTRVDLDQRIRKVLIDHRLTNMHGEVFWSKRLLKALFTQDTVNQLLTQDASWKEEAAEIHIDGRELKHEQSAFLNFIMTDRTRLLAAMVRTRLQIACLYRLWKSGYKHHDNITLDRSALGDKLDDFEVDDLCKHMASFNPVTFARPFDKQEPIRHKRVNTGQVVPVTYDLSEGKDKVEIGKGSFGTVYRVKVQGDYHGFSANKDECYALKCLNRKLESTAEVDREAGVLEMLALRPHEHITPLYASWTREGLTYILLPKAERSLQQFLRQEPRPDLTNQDTVIWLFTQLRGLAAAVGHIHHIGFDETDSTSLAAVEARKRKLHMGYHHDLKPGNILIFGNRLKISDFGAAKIHQLVSGKTAADTPFTNNSPYGDETYGGPDWFVSSSAKYGQGYDIWSLGCIYFEILLWATGYGERLGDIANQRMHKPSKCHKNCYVSQNQGGANMAIRADKRKTEESTTEDEEGVPRNDMTTHSYWYQCEKGNCHLKPSVEDWLHTVKASHCTKNELLLGLYQEIRKMLKIKPENRISAGVVRDNIGNLLYQAEVNFIRDSFENFGCDVHMGDIESDNTYVESASNYVPDAGSRRPRSDTLEPSSAHRSPSGRISSDEAVRDVGSSFQSDERALESGTDVGTNTPRTFIPRRRSTRTNHGRKPSLVLTGPNGKPEPIEHMDEAPRHRARRHKSLSSIRLAETTYESDILSISMRSTRPELSQHVSEFERIVSDSPQQESETLQARNTDTRPSIDRNRVEVPVNPNEGGTVPVQLNSVNSTDLYWNICGEAIRQLQ